MNNRGPDTNQSQFMICLTENWQLDDVHVVFGQVVEGLDVVRIISNEPLRDKLSRPVVIDCVRNRSRKKNRIEDPNRNETEIL
ncbi:hypothetical protein YC2023_005366 [Brassica napus]